MRKLFGFWAGAAIGAALMYVLDPGSGRRRRAVIRDKALHAEREAAVGAEKTRRDLANRARGFFAELLSAFEPDQADDDIIVARVRARLGQVCSHPHAIETKSTGGLVRLTGSVLGEEHRRVVSAIRRVRGVRGVEDGLQVHAEPGASSELQGGVSPRVRPS